MVAGHEFLQILVADQALLPQMLEEGKVWAARAKRVAQQDMFLGQVLHATVPGQRALVAGDMPVTQRALHAARGLLAAEVGAAVRLPVVSAGENGGTAQEPKDALEEGRAGGRGRQMEDAVVLLEQRPARQVAGEPSADRRVRDRGRGLAVGVAQRGRVGGGGGVGVAGSAAVVANVHEAGRYVGLPHPRDQLGIGRLLGPAPHRRHAVSKRSLLLPWPFVGRAEREAVDICRSRVSWPWTILAQLRVSGEWPHE